MKIKQRIKNYNLNTYLNDYVFFKDDEVYLSSFQDKNLLDERETYLVKMILREIGYKTIAKRNELTIIQFSVNRFVQIFERIVGCYDE